MYKTLESCPLCGKQQYKNFIICEDHTVTKESFAIVQCDHCHFKFTNPIPSHNQLQKYYESEDYISHSNKSNSFINTAYKIVRSFTLRNKLAIIERLSKSKKKKILDIGCGTGEFLSMTQKAGWDATGVEPNKLARSQANNNHYKVFESIDEIIERKTFTTITMWHVLEHVENLSGTLEKLNTLLSKNGTLLIAVPNHLSYDGLKYGQHWAGYDVPRHLYHFSQTTMGLLLKKHGFKIAHTLPMKWDAYYVSLLSEKYKNGTNKLIQSIINGYKSNSYAKKNDNNYSSLIFIARK